MKRTGMLVLLSVSASQLVAQGSKDASGAVPAKVSALGETRDTVCSEVMLSPRGNLLACTSSKPDLRIIERASHKTTVLIDGMYAGDLAWSRAGDRLAFYWNNEEGRKERHVWTIMVDPRTGAKTGEPRRVSVSEGSDPSFSPDGQSIAFGTRAEQGKRHLVVVAATGGTERSLAEGNVFGPYSWSPDGKSIYYGHQTNPGSYEVDRVPAVGGESERVGEISKNFHGLSPDGRYLFSASDPSGGTVLERILDSHGQSVALVFIPMDLHDGTGSGEAWMTTSGHAFFNRTVRPVTLHGLTMATGQTRDLVLPADRPRDPDWSPDGRRISVQVWTGTRWDIAVMNADGGGRRLLHTGAEPRAPIQDGGYWSPDSRYMAYVSMSADTATLFVVDLSSGKETRLVRGDPAIGRIHWRSDSRAIQYAAAGGPAGQLRTSLHVVALGGHDQMVRDVGPVAPGFVFLNDTTVLEVAPGVLLPFGDGEPRQLHSPTNPRPRPGVSRDGRWVAFLPNGLGGPDKPGMYDIVSTDGRTRQTVTLPPGMQSTAPLFSGDNKSLIVPNARGRTLGNSEAPMISLVPIDGSPPRQLGAHAKGEALAAAELALSPDGKTLLYTGQAPPIQTYVDVDFTGALNVKQASQPKKP